MAATNWELLDRTVFKFQCVQISVVVPMAYLAMLNHRLWVAPWD